MKKFSKILIFLLVFSLGLGAGVGLIYAKPNWFSVGEQQLEETKKRTSRPGPLIDLGEFTVNLAGGGALKTEITLEGYENNSEKILREKETFLTDRAISVLAAQKIGTVAQTEGKEEIKKELLDELNQLCYDEIKEILFTSYLYSW